MAKAKSAAGMLSGADSYPPTGHLNSHHLKQFGVKGPPQLGDRIPMHGRVKSVSENADGGHDVSVELEKMVQEASKPEHATDHEGKLKGAKAAMDRALDEQEMSKPELKKHRKKVGSTGAQEAAGDGEED